MRKGKGLMSWALLGLVLLSACGEQEGTMVSVAELTPIELGDLTEADFAGGGQKKESADGPGESSDGISGTNGEASTDILETVGNGVVNSEREGTTETGQEGNSGKEGAAGTSQEGNPGKEGAAGTSQEGNPEKEGAAGAGGELPGGELPVGAEGMYGGDGDGKIRITVSAAGDVTMGNYIGQGYEISFRQTYDQGVGDSYFFENVADIFSADDLTLVNLEGPLTRSEDFREGQTYCISGDPEYVNILTAGSVEAVSMGNNHRLDYKEQGTADTVAALEEAGIPYAYDNNYCMYETKGIQIGIVSVNEVGQGAGVEKYLQEGIEKLRQDGADLVFACCHWGIEREYYPEDYQKSLGKKCIDWGYDLVIGHHPHVLQGIEEYQGKFIVYSLGNFCFGANRNPADKDCMIFQQTFTFADGEKQEDQEIRVIPCSISSVTGRNDYKPTPAQGDEAGRILDKINECSRDMGVTFDREGFLTKE